jgi:hypothetical protein
MIARPRGGFGRLTVQVGSFPRATLFAVFCPFALALGLSAPLTAAPQQPDNVPPVSLDRIREGLSQAPALELKTSVPVQLPPVFKSRVDQRVFVLTLEQALHKEFDLNILQRQSADWASKCCGFNLGQLLTVADEAVRDRKIRKTREQIARELAELEAAAKKAPRTDVK